MNQIDPTLSFSDKIKMSNQKLYYKIVEIVYQHTEEKELRGNDHREMAAINLIYGLSLYYKCDVFAYNPVDVVCALKEKSVDELLSALREIKDTEIDTLVDNIQAHLDNGVPGKDISQCAIKSLHIFGKSIEYKEKILETRQRNGMECYDFIDHADHTITYGKSHYPQAVKLRIQRKNALFYVMNIISQLEHPTERDEYIRLDYWGSFRRRKENCGRICRKCRKILYCTAELRLP